MPEQIFRILGIHLLKQSHDLLSVHRVIKHDQIVTISSQGRVFVNVQISMAMTDRFLWWLPSVNNSLILEYLAVLDIRSSMIRYSTESHYDNHAILLYMLNQLWGRSFCLLQSCTPFFIIGWQKYCSFSQI